MNQNIVNKTCCKNCGAIRKNGDVGLCPECGKTGRVIYASIEGKMGPISGALGWKHTKEYYEQNRSLQIIVWAITIISPLVGLFLAGIAGVILGFILGISSYFFGVKAITKIREIRSGGDL